MGLGAVVQPDGVAHEGALGGSEAAEGAGGPGQLGEGQGHGQVVGAFGEGLEALEESGELGEF